MERSKTKTLQQQQQQPQWTHFINIPLNKVNVVKQYETIKTEVCAEIPELEPFFLGSSKAHITLNMLNLNEDQAKKIQELWPSIEKEVAKFTINLNGWGFFGKKPEKSKYLYFKINQGLEEINKVGNVVTKMLVESNILDPQLGPLHNIKIVKEDLINRYELQTAHATFMKSRTKDTFDSKFVMDKYPDFKIQDILVDSIHCSIIKPQHPDLYYVSLCEANLI